MRENCSYTDQPVITYSQNNSKAFKDTCKNKSKSGDQIKHNIILLQNGNA